MYCSSKEMLRRAKAEKYAVGAFNVENMEMAMAVIAVAEKTGSPVILQTTPSTVKYAGTELYHANVRALAEKASVPVALHLDHGDSKDRVMSALCAGYSSVMIDYSAKPLDENIRLTGEIVELASAVGIPVEAELGKVGGKEDDTVADGCAYTDPMDAVRFVKETGIDSLAVAIGTAHGVYSTTPVLDVDRLAQIEQAIAEVDAGFPLVLHGASGLTGESVRACIQRGICKVNFATELRIAYTNGVREVLKDEKVFDPKKYGKAGMEKVKKTVLEKMEVCGCLGKAKK